MTAPNGSGFPGPAPRLAGATSLVGRDDELATIIGATARPPAVVVVEGEAGIGKTRIVDEVRARVPGVVVGSCQRVSDPFPLGPVIEVARQLRGPLAAAALSPVAGALRPLLPELADLLPPAPEPIADRQAESHRVFRALVEVLGTAEPLVMILEDLHWADGLTADFLHYLLADPPPRLSVVLTFRGDEVSPAMRAVPARLPRSVHRRQVTLTPLDVAGTGALAAAFLATDRVSDEFAEYLRERSSGLPFAIEELLALLLDRGSVAYRHGGWARWSLGRLDVPTTIRDQVLERVSNLGEDARTVLAAAAVLQNAVTLPVLAATSRLPQGRCLAGLDEARQAGVLAETENGVGFRHVLAAQAVYEDIPALRRRRLHARAADALRALDPPPLGQIAQHLRHSDRHDEWIEVAEHAADQAITLGHDGEATRQLEDVLRHARPSTPLAPALAGRLALKLAEVATNIGRHQVTDLLTQVLAEPDLDRDLRGELCLRTAVLASDYGREDVPRQRQLLRAAIEHLRPHQVELRTWAMACLGIPLGATETRATLREWLTRALAELSAVTDPDEHFRFLGKIAMGLVLIGDPRWRELADQLLTHEPGDAARHVGQAWTYYSTYYSIGLEGCYVGHHRIAGEFAARALAHSATWDGPVRQATLRSAELLVDYCRGAWDGLARRADRLAEQLADHVHSRADVDLVAGCLRLASGDLDGARTRLRALLDRIHDGAVIDLRGMLLDAWVRLALADRDLDAAVTPIWRELGLITVQGIWVHLSRCLPTMVEALLAAGEPTTATDLVRTAAREFDGLAAPLAVAALRQARGVLAAGEQRWRLAAGHFQAAADDYARRECPYEAARALEQVATCRFHLDEPAAERPWRDALAAYQRLGAGWDADRAAALGRRHGAAPPTRHRRGRRGYGTGLSPREREVAELIAAGRSNQEIAGELFLSVSTVEKHAMAVLRKLGAPTRHQVRHRLSAE